MSLVTIWRPSGGVLTRPGRPDRIPGKPIIVEPPVITPEPETPPVDDRDLLVYGQYQPGPTNTGYRGTLTDLGNSSTQNAVLPSSGVVENRKIWGDIKPPATGKLVLKNCLLVGGPHIPTGASGAVNCNTAHAENLILIDCTIQPQQPRNRDCIVGHKWEAYRCNMSRSVDGMGIFTTSANSGHADVIAMGNWIHDLAYVYPDYKNGTSGATWHTDGSHNDGAQLQGGDRVHLKGNFFDLARSLPAAGNGGVNPDKTWMSTLQETNGSCVIVQSNTGNPINNTVIIEQNWFRGGLSQLNVKPNMSFIFRDNKHYRDAAVNTTGSGGTWNGYWLRFDQRAGATLTGLATNKWVDGPYSGQVMAEPRDKGIHYNA